MWAEVLRKVNPLALGAKPADFSTYLTVNLPISNNNKPNGGKLADITGKCCYIHSQLTLQNCSYVVLQFNNKKLLIIILIY